jgi:hypothetical protein
VAAQDFGMDCVCSHARLHTAFRKICRLGLSAMQKHIYIYLIVYLDSNIVSAGFAIVLR